MLLLVFWLILKPPTLGVTSKPAIEGHFKTGHRSRPGQE
jgi:hypothetical protein